MTRVWLASVYRPNQHLFYSLRFTASWPVMTWLVTGWLVPLFPSCLWMAWSYTSLLLDLRGVSKFFTGCPTWETAAFRLHPFWLWHFYNLVFMLKAVTWHMAVFQPVISLCRIIIMHQWRATPCFSQTAGGPCPLADALCRHSGSDIS